MTVPIEAKKFYAGKGADTETPLAERIEIGLFTAEPGRDAFDQSHVILMKRQPIRSGRQVLKFVSDKKPLYAGVDPYNLDIDRDSTNNVVGGGVRAAGTPPSTEVRRAAVTGSNGSGARVDR